MRNFISYIKNDKYAIGCTGQTVYVYDIYTVNKHTVRPEFEDTAFMVQNMAQYPLQTGDRAYMVLKYFYDAESVKYPQWTIEKVLDIIPTRPLQAKDSVAFEGITILCGCGTISRI